MAATIPNGWQEYELIDSGNFEKLERFGTYIISRPEPQALWPKYLSEKDWKHLSHACFKRNEREKEDGEWVILKNIPTQWNIGFSYLSVYIKMRLTLTRFKHVGIFPEQSYNWTYIYDSVRQIKTRKPNVLNLFAYTGAASLWAKAAGADVVHIDAVRPIITWASDNMVLNNMTNIKWVVEDVMKFAKREVKRGHKYNGIILDPPAYGRGPDGEKWLLEDHLIVLLVLCNDLLHENESFLIINLYSMGFSPLIAENLIKSVFSKTGKIEFGELYFLDKGNRKLPHGVFCRFRRE